MDTVLGRQAELTNWSKSARSACLLYPATDAAGISQALSAARTQRRSVIPHGAGHSYTDAALNTGGIVIDVTPMRRILAWDPSQGIMRVEPGVTLRDMVQVASKDGWWPAVSPSTPDATVGGCVAMNVNGRNAWKCGPFGANILALDVLLATGEVRKLARERDTQLLRAFVGSLGLLGILTSITLQLQRTTSGFVTLRRRSGSSLDEILALFAEEEPNSDFMEAWLDGFARGPQLGRGHITCAKLSRAGDRVPSPFPRTSRFGRLEAPLVSFAAHLGRPMLRPGVQIANRANYWRARQGGQMAGRRRALFPYTYWPPAAAAGYHALFPEGLETFQAFVPAPQAKELFEQVLRYSQQHECLPVWCILKQHRRDPFLLSYQVDGFSLELNYQRTQATAQTLERVLRHMIATVIEAGGRFYFAKDRWLTAAQFRQSVGNEAFDTFLQLKQRYDPDMLLQSDLFRRVFMPAAT
jgi:decaprenylphospho-beta-D-ribofuranose 2-oxidase